MVRRLLRKDDALVSITCTEFVGDEVTRASLHRQLDWGRKILRGMALANSEASRAVTWNVVLEPPTVRSGHDHEFCLRYRFLMILPVHEPTLFAPTVEGWTNARCHNPTERDSTVNRARVRLSGRDAHWDGRGDSAGAGGPRRAASVRDHGSAAGCRLNWSASPRCRIRILKRKENPMEGLLELLIELEDAGLNNLT